MIEAPQSEHEAQRLQALRSLLILDTEPEEAFNRVVRLAARIFDVPIAQVSLVDEHREWFKARCGTESQEGERRYAFCAHTILSDDVLVVEDAAADVRFHDNPLVTEQGVRFYAGAPLQTRAGLNLGALCIKDHVPRRFSAEERSMLRALADVVVDQMEHRLLAMRADAASEAKSRFLANMSHELRTPLNAIIGYAELLQEDAEDLNHPQLLEDLKKIERAGKHLLTLINDVLDLSKIEAGRMDLIPETFRLGEIIDDVAAAVTPLVQRNGNRLQCRAVADLGAMYADPTKVRQVLYNLLSNAAKFTQNGLVTLEAQRAPHDGADWIELRVIDTGHGIPPTLMPQLFEVFVQGDASSTRRNVGTGLGLALSRRFCRMMGGDVSVESKVGTGSTFTVRLPARMPEIPHGETPPTTAQATAAAAS